MKAQKDIRGRVKQALIINAKIFLNRLIGRAEKRMIMSDTEV